MKDKEKQGKRVHREERHSGQFHTESTWRAIPVLNRNRSSHTGVKRGRDIDEWTHTSHRAKCRRECGVASIEWKCDAWRFECCHRAIRWLPLLLHCKSVTNWERFVSLTNSKLNEELKSRVKTCYSSNAQDNRQTFSRQSWRSLGSCARRK